MRVTQGLRSTPVGTQAHVGWELDGQGALMLWKKGLFWHQGKAAPVTAGGYLGEFRAADLSCPEETNLRGPQSAQTYIGLNRIQPRDS